MPTLEEIVNAAKALPAEEQAELRRRLESLTETAENGGAQAEDGSNSRRNDLRRRLHAALYEAGLVTDINPPARTTRERHPPIKIKGKPLSETIIEDRR